MQPQPNIETRKGERLPQTLIGASNHQADQQFQFHSDSSNKQENERMGVGQMEEHIDSTFGVGMYNIEGFLYRDFSGADADTVQRLLNLSNISNRKGPRGGVALPFPLRLSNMLESNGSDLSDIVSWQSHGRCFRVHDQKRFVSEVMPR